MYYSYLKWSTLPLYNEKERNFNRYMYRNKNVNKNK